MNFRGSVPAALASEMRYSISEDVVGFSSRSREIDGNVISSYNSHTPTAPAKMRNVILVQYHTCKNGKRKTVNGKRQICGSPLTVYRLQLQAWGVTTMLLRSYWAAGLARGCFR